VSKGTVRVVYKAEEDYYDIVPKTNKSIEMMRNKIVSVKGVKWRWHVVLTFSEDDKNEIIKSGGFSGEVLRRFLINLKTINTDTKYFWKYEEGGLYGRPHFHLLIDFKINVNEAYCAEAIWKRKWKEGEVDLKKKLEKIKEKRKRKSYKGNLSDIELLMGKLLYRKWGKKGGVFANEIKGLGKEHQNNLLYYVNKDLMKRSNYNCIKKGSSKWKFSSGLKFDNVKWYDKSMVASNKKAISYLMRTKMNFIKHYDSLGMDGMSKFFGKIRKIQRGEFDEVIK